MRNLTIKHTNYPISLSHWGMFCAELVGYKEAIVTGTGLYGESVEEKISIPQYIYRPFRSGEYK